MPTRGPVQIGRHEDGQTTVATTAAHEVGAAGRGRRRTEIFGRDVGTAVGLTATGARASAPVVRVIIARVWRTAANDVVGTAGDGPTTPLVR
jgi:hypothetical protein